MDHSTRNNQHLQPPSSLRQKLSSAQFSSRSTEADDELSYASSNTSSMSPPSIEDEGDLSPPSYHGEDTRPTSRKELAGFYAYSFAAEVFVICGLGAFIPITLEDLARGSPSAVLASNSTKSCKTKIDIPEVAATLAAYGSDSRKHVNNQCVFRLLGLEINTASFAMYTFSISVLLQALVVVTMSGAADHGKFRKTMLLTFAAVGAVATMLYLPITPNAYLLGSLLWSQLRFTKFIFAVTRQAPSNDFRSAWRQTSEFKKFRRGRSYSAHVSHLANRFLQQVCRMS
jgi:hypothetical protein